MSKAQDWKVFELVKVRRRKQRHRDEGRRESGGRKEEKRDRSVVAYLLGITAAFDGTRLINDREERGIIESPGTEGRGHRKSGRKKCLLRKGHTSCSRLHVIKRREKREKEPYVP